MKFLDSFFGKLTTVLIPAMFAYVPFIKTAIEVEWLNEHISANIQWYSAGLVATIMCTIILIRERMKKKNEDKKIVDSIIELDLDLMKNIQTEFEIIKNSEVRLKKMGIDINIKVITELSSIPFVKSQ